MPVSISNLTSTWANSYFNYVGLGLNVNATEYNENSSIIKFSINDDEKLKLSPNGTLYVNGISLTAQTTELAELAYDKANSAYDIAIIGGGEISVVTIAAYDKANAANLLAYNTGIGANTFTTSTNTFLRSVIAGANTAVGTGANAFTTAANNHLKSIIVGANTAVGAGANAYLLSVIAGANTAVGTGANAYAASVGTSANAYLLSVIAGANTAVGTGANAFTTSTNTFLRSIIVGANTAVGAGANAFTTAANNHLKSIIVGANTAVGAGANAYLLSVIAGANTAVGTGANAYAASVGAGANAYLLSVIAGANTAVGAGANAYATATFLPSSSYTASDILTKIKTVDGSGSGLDADLLDGVSGASFLRSDTSDSFTSGTLTISGTSLRLNDGVELEFGSGGGTVDAQIAWSGSALEFDVNGGNMYLDFNNDYDFFIRDVNSSYATRLSVDISTGLVNIPGNLDVGSGVDVTGHITVTGTVDGRDIATDGTKLDGIESGATADQTASEILSALLTVDGSGSGLDADTLDTYQASDFPRKTENATISGDWIFNETINFNSTTATSLSTGAAWFSGSSGAILLDNGGHKRISWNDGGGNFNIRAGHYFNGTATIAAKGTNESDGGAVALVMSSDATAGVFSVSVAPTTVAGQTISSWTNTLKVDTTATSAGAGGLKYNEAQVWHAGNDGSGSGLDADLLDGQHGSYYSPLTITQIAYDKANAANLLAYNTGIGANAYAASVGTSANAYLLSVIAGANTAVGAGANAYSTATFLAKTGGIINGTLEVGGTSVSGAEGGEIRFTKAPTSTLSGSNIVLDNNGNNIRIFENGGTFRGYTFDLSTAGAGASTTLLNSTNLWSTMNMVNVKSYGAIGNGSNDDTSSINSAIAYINSNGGILYFPKGNYKVTSELTSITKGGIKIVGDGIGNTVITPVGTFTLFTIGGTSTRVYWMNIENIYIYGLNHTGIVFNLDHTQGISFYNVFLDNCYNPVNMRQVHNTTFEDFYCENIRGNYGMKIYASGSTRNSTTERSDILNLERVILAGNNSAGSSHANSCKLLHIDGFIASIYMDKVQLLRGHTGIYCVNSPGLPYGSYPQFIQGQNLDLEFNYYNAAYISHLEGLNITNLYCHGAVTDIGMNFGADTSGIRLSNGKIAGHAAFGAAFNGTGIGLTDIDVYNNGTAVPNGYDGIYLSSTVNGFQMIGGSAGKAPWFSYTETQRYGINISSGAARSQLIGVRLNGNATGTYFGSATTSGLVTS